MLPESHIVGQIFLSSKHNELQGYKQQPKKLGAICRHIADQGMGSS